MASCEIVNSARIKIQSRGICPSIAIDKTDGIVVYLSKDSLDSEIVCTKSSEMNVIISFIIIIIIIINTLIFYS
jgi:adenylyl cyclase-associated protein